MILSETKAQYEMPEEGDHQAVCAYFVDLGEQPTNFDGKKGTKHKCAIVFELDQKKAEGDYAGQPFVLTKMFGANLNPKGKLRPFLESWRKKPFTEEELAAFNTDQLVGANCIVNIVHELKADGSTRAEIASIRPIRQGMQRMIPSLQEVPEWIRKMQGEGPVMAGVDSDVEQFGF